MRKSIIKNYLDWVIRILHCFENVKTKKTKLISFLGFIYIKLKIIKGIILYKTLFLNVTIKRWQAAIIIGGIILAFMNTYGYAIQYYWIGRGIDDNHHWVDAIRDWRIEDYISEDLCNRLKIVNSEVLKMKAIPNANPYYQDIEEFHLRLTTDFINYMASNHLEHITVRLETNKISIDVNKMHTYWYVYWEKHEFLKTVAVTEATQKELFHQVCKVLMFNHVELEGVKETFKVLKAYYYQMFKEYHMPQLIKEFPDAKSNYFFQSRYSWYCLGTFLIGVAGITLLMTDFSEDSLNRSIERLSKLEKVIKK